MQCSLAEYHSIHRYDIVNSRWPEDLDEDKLKLVQKRFLALPDVLSMQDFLSGWFHGAPFETIRRDNVLEYLAYVFHDGVYKDLSAEVCLIEDLLCHQSIDVLH